MTRWLSPTVLILSLALGGATAGWTAPAGAAAARGDAAGKVRAGRHGAVAGRTGHHRRRVAGLRRHRRFAAVGLPAGYAADDSPFDVQADDDAFDTGAFYGCLHTVMTAGGYRPAATCR